ncbi:hypothetical protein C2E23DRAFT_889971 [Lenzites betulinus]|nr:hypothetical protein C2E23DRAFT_889971 [Lenzites betulinus]
MSLPDRAGTSNTRPKAKASALGFLSRGIQSVSSFVGNISTIFGSSSVSPALVTSAHEEDVTPATPRDSESQASDEGRSPSGSSSSEDGTTGHSTPALDTSGSSDDGSSAPGTSALASTSSESQPGLATATPEAGPSSTRLRNPPLRRAGQPDATLATQSTPDQAPRRRGVLRREPVWIDGQDPRDVTPASELRGRDPRTIRENRYWLDAWGPLPTLWDIHPGTGRPTVPMIIEWLGRRYGRLSEPFWQAADHIFPLPDGTEFQPRFTRILRTSIWRNQDGDWEGGITPVERVYEPARADDAADSGAEEESVGYVSDSDMDMDTDTPEPAGPSSTALVPVSGRTSSSHSSTGSSALPSSSPGAGPSRRPLPSRKRRHESSSDAEDSTTSTPERPTTRRRLNSGPAATTTPRTRRPRPGSHTPRLAPRNATFVPHPRPMEPGRTPRARDANAVAGPSVQRPSPQPDPQASTVASTSSSSVVQAVVSAAAAWRNLGKHGL